MVQRLPAQVRADDQQVDVGRLEARGDLGEPPIATRRARQHDAEREPGNRPGRHGQGREVEQVREVRVGPESRVDPDRVGLHLGDRRVTGGRRGQQRVAAVERAGGGGREAVEALPVREVAGRTVLRGVEDDRRDDRVKVAADEPLVLADVAAHRRVPLSDERPAVQQARDLEERRDVDRDDLGPA